MNQAAQLLKRARELQARLRALEAERGDWTRWLPETWHNPATGREEPYRPHPKQEAFLALDSFEAFYGGAAGGGKSDALLMAALQYVHVPGYAAILFRRTFPDLNEAGAIMDRAKMWLIPRGVAWNGEEKRFTFPSGARISFGHLNHDLDRYKYQGAEFQFIGFDEATQFPEKWYRYLLSRCRKNTSLTVPLRVRGAGNPGGLGHAWVKARFVDGTDASRPFIPATVEDNPAIDPIEYARTLSLLDPVTRRQLLEGIWVQDGSGLVYRQFDEARNLIEAPPSGITRHVLGIDFGFTDATAWTLLGWRPHDPATYILLSFSESELTTAQVAERTALILERYPCDKIVGDIGGLGKAYVEEMRRRPPFIPIEAADKLNKFGYIGLMNGALSRGLIKVVRPECEQLVKEWRELPWDEARQKEAAGAENHCADSALYGWRASQSYTAKTEPPLILPVDRFQAREAAYLKEKAQQARVQSRRKWLTR